MTSLPLFANKRELFYTLLVVAILFLSSLSYEFYKYKKLTAYSLHVSFATVIKHYEKKSVKGKNYHVFKLKSDNFSFFTVRWDDSEAKKGDIVKVAFYTKDIDFYSYLKGFFATSKFLQVVEKNQKSPFIAYVENQHEYELSRELYNALFFANPISKDLRADITKWGIAHLIAISGFHLGILSALFYFLLRPIYTLFQDRYFPYRNSFADLAFLVFMILGMYIYLIDFTPSILRAYVMSLVGFLLFSRGIKILSFATLLLTISIILIFFPKLIVSIAFWFSVSGVFYIFLFLQHFSKLNKISIFLLINFWVFILMLPIVHFIFEPFSLFHLFSPFISMIFVVFYPLSLVLHVVNIGGIFDEALLWFLSLDVDIKSIIVPLWFLLPYLFLSLLAIRLRVLAFFLPFAALGVFFI
jgi:competence protein ComEC